MPTYQYHCEKNGETLEVQHRMTETLKTWGQLCAKLERDLGKTPADAPIETVISGGLMAMVNGGTPKSESLLPMAGCCGNPTSCHHH